MYVVRAGILCLMTNIPLLVLRLCSCRSDPNDALENADFIGLNAYLHCDGTLTDPNSLPGFEALLSDFQTYETTVPVLVCFLATVRLQDCLLVYCSMKYPHMFGYILSTALRVWVYFCELSYGWRIPGTTKFSADRNVVLRTIH